MRSAEERGWIGIKNYYMSNAQRKSMDHLKLRYVVTEEHNAPALLKKYNKLRRVAYHTKIHPRIQGCEGTGRDGLA